MTGRGRREITVPYAGYEGEPRIPSPWSAARDSPSPGRLAVATRRRPWTLPLSRHLRTAGDLRRGNPGLLGLLWLRSSGPGPPLGGVLPEPHGRIAGVPGRGRAGGSAREFAARVPDAYPGRGPGLLGFLGTPSPSAASGAGRAGRRAERSPAWVAVLIALGIGLHNLGEGLAIGASYATGEIALGTFLVIGFLIHNTTEGLGSSLRWPANGPRSPPRAARGLGALAGVPTVLGTWIGGFSCVADLDHAVLRRRGGRDPAGRRPGFWRLFPPLVWRPRLDPPELGGRDAGHVLMYASGVTLHRMSRLTSILAAFPLVGAGLWCGSWLTGRARHRGQQLPDRGGVQPGSRRGAAHQHLLPASMGVEPGTTPSPRSGRSAASPSAQLYPPAGQSRGRSGGGIGDVALNYRYQLVASQSTDGATAVHVAPRASLLLPTGSESEGRGTGDFGVQANLPVSWVVSPALVTHWNAGVTIVSSAADFNLGASAIYRLRRSVNLLVEAVWLDPDGVYLNPGVRWAHDFAGGLQVVPGCRLHRGDRARCRPRCALPLSERRAPLHSVAGHTDRPAPTGIPCTHARSRVCGAPQRPRPDRRAGPGSGSRAGAEHRPAPGSRCGRHRPSGHRPGFAAPPRRGACDLPASVPTPRGSHGAPCRPASTCPISPNCWTRPIGWIASGWR